MQINSTVSYESKSWSFLTSFCVLLQINVIVVILIQIREILFLFIQETVCQIPLSFKMWF